MFGSAILEVAIGVIFVFILFSILCAAVREGIESWLKTRAAYLERGIRELLHDPKAAGLAKSLYTHPLIYGLYVDAYKSAPLRPRPSVFDRGGNLPSYIPAKNFALALMDIAARGPGTDAVSSNPESQRVTLDAVRRNVLNIQNEPVQRVLLIAVDSAQEDLGRAQAAIEHWYDSAMDRVSGWYKRSTQRLIFWIALCAAVALNINTITIADFLYRTDAIRGAIVARAGTTSQDTAFIKSNYEEARGELDKLGLPIGWTDGWGAPKRGAERGANRPWNDIAWNDWVAPFLGWLITAFAASLGAPFWFDVLNKVMVIRSTVKPHEKSPEEGSEDRQPASDSSRRDVPVTVETQRKSSAPSFGSVRDDDSGVDGCGVPVQEPTRDDELPSAQGGVA